MLDAMNLADQSPDVPPLGVGGPRSEATRRAILDTARSIFAARGYDQTTIRAVATRAGIDGAMVMRYFGSKAGLFTAASTVDLDPPDLRSVPEPERGERLVRHIVDRWEHGPTHDSLEILLRTAATNESVAGQLQSTFDTLIAVPVRALGTPDAERRSALIATQLLGLALCRYILKLEPVTSLPVDEVVASVAATVQRYLTEPLA
jgi:AcrR family transcriptional regulator